MYAASTLDAQVGALRQQIKSTEGQLRDLKTQLQQAEQKAQAAKHLDQAYDGGLAPEWTVHVETLAALSQEDVLQDIRSGGHFTKARSRKSPQGRPLTGQEYKRYGRQLIMPEVGLQGQLRLKSAKVLIVGAGGLGCPAAAYLAGAGVGTIGLVDGDTVEVSNLHRQIAHSTARVGIFKVDSVIEYLSALNPLVQYIPHHAHLTAETAIRVTSQYDLVLDCTDHPTSRYLISDACVLTGKPVVSASALRAEGQLHVLNNPPAPVGDATGGPCYRCIFPKPPPADSVLGCGEGGILGPVVGVMGVLQALEAIKLLIATPSEARRTNGDVEMDDGPTAQPLRPTMLMFSAWTDPAFRSVRLRSRRKDCSVCSQYATVTKGSLTSGSLDYMAFCGAASPANILGPQDQIDASAFAILPQDGSRTLVDVRDETQFSLCNLPGSVNIPWTGNAESWMRAYRRAAPALFGGEVYTICRLGNDSQSAAKILLESGHASQVKDVKGGFRSWMQNVDPEWPDY